MHTSTTIFICAVVFLYVTANVDAQTSARWCTISSVESSKCIAMKDKFASQGLTPQILCVVGTSAQDCMEKIHNNEADLITLDGGDVYIAGRDYGMKPVMEEIYEEGKRGYYAVAVVKKSNTNININNLKGKKSCHTGVKKTAGWNVPIGTLLENGMITPVDCQEDIKSAGQFFSASCAPGALTPEYDPAGDNPKSLCQLCLNECERNSHEQYYNYAGAFRCMAEGAGDVAFIKPQTVLENTDNNNQDAWALNLASTDYELLCKDGTRKAVTEAATCNLAQVPPHVLMTGGTKTSTEVSAFQNLLNRAQDIFGDDKNPEAFQLFSSHQYLGGKDLLFKDSTIRLETINNQKYDQVLGNSYVESIEGLNKCPDNTVRWCVISQLELYKCRNMSEAFKLQGLTPEISCYLDVDHNACMKSISDGEADLVALDGGDIYQGGKQYDLRPLLAEIYADQGDATYWGVAVVKSSSNFNINELKGKKSCHTGIMKSSGWVVPVGHLIDRGDIKVSNCDIPAAVGEFFSMSCAPGSKTDAYDPLGTNPNSLCELCAGTGENKCARSSDEPYYGYDGAFRCLVEDAGEVAFVKHTTVPQNLLSSDFTWSNGFVKNNFQLLCRDGERAAIDDWMSCNLAKIPSHAVVTSPRITTTKRSQIATLLLEAQKTFAHDSNTNGFKMFDSSSYSMDGQVGSNLLFKDATINLQDVGARDEYDEYLSPEYLADLNAIYCDTTGGATTVRSSAILVASLYLLVITLMKFV